MSNTTEAQTRLSPGEALRQVIKDLVVEEGLLKAAADQVVTKAIERLILTDPDIAQRFLPELDEDDILQAVADRYSSRDIANQVDIDDLADEISLGQLAAQIPAGDLVDEFDMDEIVEKVKNEICMDELARLVSEEIMGKLMKLPSGNQDLLANNLLRMIVPRLVFFLRQAGARHANKNHPGILYDVVDDLEKEFAPTEEVLPNGDINDQF